MTVPHETTDWPWKIPLRRRDGTVRAYALVDQGDYEALSAYRWNYDDGYARRTGSRPQRRSVYMHRTILGLSAGDGMEGDHRNLDRLDNRRGNLRVIPRAGNPQNTGSHHRADYSPERRSRYRGVSWVKAKQRWRACATLRGRQHHLGYFDDEMAAARAAAAFRAEHMPFSAEAR